MNATRKCLPTNVTPFAGVWIEITVFRMELPRTVVTPFAGVWIEIIFRLFFITYCKVTPFAGVWIEMPCSCYQLPVVLPSLPSRECGLKSLA